MRGTTATVVTSNADGQALVGRWRGAARPHRRDRAHHVMSPVRCARGFVSARRNRRSTAGGVVLAAATSQARRAARSRGIGHIVALERALAGEHLVEHHAECPDVTALVGRLALRLLRRHIGRGAEVIPAAVIAGVVIWAIG